MDFLGGSCSSQEPNHFFYPPPPPCFVCFPILAFGLLFVSSHVGLYLIIVLLFLCQQFIPLPCHLIMCCAVILCGWWCYLGYWLVSMCVHSLGLLAQVNTLKYFWGDCSLRATHQQIFLLASRCHCLSLCCSLSCSSSFFLYPSFRFHSHINQPNNHFLSLCFPLFLSDRRHEECLSLSPTSSVHCPSLSHVLSSAQF